MGAHALGRKMLRDRRGVVKSVGKWLTSAALVVAASAANGNDDAARERLTSAKYRYKFTLQIMAYGELISSEVVQAIEISTSPILSPSKYTLRLRGEALVVDLGARGRLVAVMGALGWDIQYTSMTLFACDLPLLKEMSPGDFVGRFMAIDKPCSVQPNQMPFFLLVPASGQAANAIGSRYFDFEATFGPNLKVISATVAPTTESLPRDMGEALSVVSAFEHGAIVSLNVSTIRRPVSLHRNDFLREDFE